MTLLGGLGIGLGTSFWSPLPCCQDLPKLDAQRKTKAMLFME